MSQFSALNLWPGEEVVSFNGFVVENVTTIKMLLTLLSLFIQLCTELRLKGNGHFVKGDYRMAVALYSRAIKLR